MVSRSQETYQDLEQINGLIAAKKALQRSTPRPQKFDDAKKAFEKRILKDIVEALLEEETQRLDFLL